MAIWLLFLWWTVDVMSFYPVITSVCGKLAELLCTNANSIHLIIDWQSDTDDQACDEQFSSDSLSNPFLVVAFWQLIIFNHKATSTPVSFLPTSEILLKSPLDSPRILERKFCTCMLSEDHGLRIRFRFCLSRRTFANRKLSSRYLV